MNSKTAKQIYSNIQELGVLKSTLAKHPECKKKLLNKLKSQENISDESGLESLRNIANKPNATLDELHEIDWKTVL